MFVWPVVLSVHRKVCVRKLCFTSECRRKWSCRASESREWDVDVMWASVCAFYCHVYTDGENRCHIGAPVQTVVSVRLLFLWHRVQTLWLQPAGQVQSRCPVVTLHTWPHALTRFNCDWTMSWMWTSVQFCSSTDIYCSGKGFSYKPAIMRWESFNED